MAFIIAKIQTCNPMLGKTTAFFSGDCHPNWQMANEILDDEIRAQKMEMKIRKA